MTKFTIDVRNGELVLRGTNTKAPGGNAKKRPKTDLKWEAAPNTGLRFDLAFERLEYADGPTNPTAGWPFGRVISTDGAVDEAKAVVTDASHFEAEIGENVLGTFKYSIKARFMVEAELDPVIIIEH